MTPVGSPRIGIVGTGFVSRGVYSHLASQPDLQVTRVLTRRPLDLVLGFPAGILTDSPDELIENADILFECSGDAVHATRVLQRAGAAGRKLVTMNSEFQITTGSWLIEQGYYLTEALGDQPGCQAELRDDALEMGFEPLCFLSLKGYLHTNPSPADMKFWADKQGLSLAQVVSFTDGSKLQIEQALVANGLGATIAQDGMIGRRVTDLGELDFLVERADEIGQAISDYVVFPGGPPGVLLLGRNAEMSRLPGYLPFSNIATAGGKAYRLLRPHHLCHLEVLKTLRSVIAGDPPLLHNSLSPTVTVAAVAKHAMKAGARVDRGLGSFDFRGTAVRIDANRDAMPITLMDSVRLRNDVEKDQILDFDDVELEHPDVAEIYRRTIERR